MKIAVRYFASVRERLGPGQDLVWTEDASDAPTTVDALRQWLVAQSPAHAAVLAATPGLRFACNQTLCPATQPLSDGAEVAFFPPVTGG